MQLNETSLDTLCAALCEAIGIPAPAQAAQANAQIREYIAGRKCDRIVMYNPDAIAEWIWQKYPQLFKEVTGNCELEVSYRTVMPSVTPVCFGTMYTGAQPSVHGIQKYEKPVIRIDTFFDALIRAGKKVAIIADDACSMGKIFREREMDYFTYPAPTIPQTNAKAAELILKDEYDVLCIYNGNYDSVMHKTGPESLEALSEARANAEAFGMFCEMIKSHWKQHRTFVAFAMDHGCHEIDENCGSHGLDMPEDLNIRHSYRIFEPEA